MYGKPLGPFIPEILSPPIEEITTKDDYMSLILSDSQSVLDRDGTIRAVEGFGAVPGDMELQIYRPSCGNDSCPFPSNAILCPEPSILCMRTKTCINPSVLVADPSSKPLPGNKGSSGSKGKEQLTNRKELKDICRTPISGPQFAEYKLMRRVKLTILKGYFFIRLSKARNLKPGDLLALRTRGGLLAKRKIMGSESPDWKLDDGNPDEPLKHINSGQMVALKDAKYLIKIMTYEDLKFSPFHDYTNSSEFSVTLKVSSPWLTSSTADGAIVFNRQLTVSQSINKLRARVIPPNAPVGAPVSVSIILSSGSLVKLTWDFGDGESDSDQVDVTTPNEKFTRFHNYTSPGVYDIHVSARNIQSDTSATHRLIAQHPVSKAWKLSTNSPQLLPGLFCSGFVLFYCFSGSYHFFSGSHH